MDSHPASVGYKYRPGHPGWGLDVGLTTLPCKRENVEKPPRNSAGFCGGGQGLYWAVEPREQERKNKKLSAST
jgi:hypothetical protein